jgi:hypothetical protein
METFVPPAGIDLTRYDQVVAIGDSTIQDSDVTLALEKIHNEALFHGQWRMGHSSR